MLAYGILWYFFPSFAFILFIGLTAYDTQKLKRIAIEKKERSGPVETAKKIERFEEARIGQAEGFPAALARCSSLWINSVLRWTSLARSSVEADDKLPTPVFEKSGSGL